MTVTASCKTQSRRENLTERMRWEMSRVQEERRASLRPRKMVGKNHRKSLCCGGYVMRLALQNDQHRRLDLGVTRVENVIVTVTEQVYCIIMQVLQYICMCLLQELPAPHAP